jgi:DNA-binding NarL/FixJ family response regulator
MSVSVQKIAVIDAMSFRRAMVESFLAGWAKYESIDLISIPPEEARAKLGDDVNCRMLIYFAARGPSLTPEMLDEIQEFRVSWPAAALVIVSDDVSLDGMRAAINAGAQGYFDIAMQPALALHALSFVLHGGTYFPPAAILAGHSGAAFPHRNCDADNASAQQESPASPLKQCDLGHLGSQIQDSTFVGKHDAVAKTAPPQMTARQEAVISCLCVGDSNKAIARKLGMTETTVKVHVREVMRKLCVSNRTQVAIVAASNGLAHRSVAGRFYQDA